MGKLFSWVVIGLLGYLAYRLLQIVQRKSLAARGAAGGPLGPSTRAAGTAGNRELMLRCEVCGTHVPASDAIKSDGHLFCSAAHRDRAHEQAREQAKEQAR